MITTAAAIIGSAVLGAGATMLSSSKAAKAADKQGDLAYQATQDNIAENRREFDTINANNAPARNLGNSAMSAIGGGFGLSGYGAPSMTAPRVASTPVPNAGGISMSGRPAGPRTIPGVPDGSYAYSDTFGAGAPGTMSGGIGHNGGSSMTDQASADAYLAANPDVMAWAQSGHGDPNIPIEQQSIEDRAAYQFRNSGQAEGRSWPTASMTDPTPTQTGDGGYQPPPGYADPTAPNGYMTGPRPDPGAAPTRTPFGTLDISLGAYNKSPYYDWVQSEGLKGLDHVASSMTGLMNGARIKAAERFNNNLASTDYTDWRNYTTGQFNIDRGRADNQYTQDLGQYDANRARSDGLYADDRANANSRYDTRNSQLLSLAGFGQGATNSTNAAATSFAQSDAQARMAGATAQGGAAVNGANAFTSGVNNLITTGAYLGGRLMSNPANYYGVNSGPLFTGDPSETAGLY